MLLTFSGAHLGTDPIGKMIAFQQVLFNEAPGAAGAAAADDSTWLRVGAEVEVLMNDEDLYGSRYVAAVLEIEEGRAHCEFVEFFEDDEGTARLKEWHPCNALRPVPPTARDWQVRLRAGSPCEVLHEGGWYEALVIDRVKLEGGADGFSVQAVLFPEIKQETDGGGLRPRWAFVDGTDWLALPPLGFKLPLGTAEYTVTEASGGGALRSTEAMAARAAAKAEREAEKAAAKAKRAAQKAAREAAAKQAAINRARARAEGGLPGLILRALRAGHAHRDAIVAWVAEHGEGCSMKTSRDAVVTCLGKEPHKEGARWTQEGEWYQLCAGSGADNADAAAAADGDEEEQALPQAAPTEEETPAGTGGAPRPTGAAAEVAAPWPVGEVVWARMRGYPAWPAVTSEPPYGKPDAKPGDVWVLFLGTHDHSWAEVSAWSDRKPSVPGKRSLQASYRKALLEAQAALGEAEEPAAKVEAADAAAEQRDAADGAGSTDAVAQPKEPAATE